MKSYSVNEMFYSLQGEGARAGTANVFVRLSGCNLACSRESNGFDCDTEFSSGVKMSAEEIADRAKALIPEGARDPSAWGVIFTGGEPMLQLDLPLLQRFETWGCIAIETNGTHDIPFGGAQLFVSCSPKTAEHTLKLKEVDELRYVRAFGQGLPKPSIKAKHLFISPAFEPGGYLQPGTLRWCIEMVKSNPEWRLSVQQHKAWGVR